MGKLSALKGIVNAVKNGVKAKKALNPAIQAANTTKAMRATIFGGIGAVAAGSILTSCEKDFYHGHDLITDTEVNLKYIDIPTKTDTIFNDRVIRDTLYLPGQTVRDTVFIDRPGESVRDTIYLPGEVVRDTIFQDKIVHDTIRVEVPGETIEVPYNPEYRGEVEPVLDDITNILAPGTDLDGVTVLMRGTKMFEQHDIESRIAGNECSEREQVYGMHVVDFENDHNPTTYVKQMRAVKTSINGKPAALFRITPPRPGSEKKTYAETSPADWQTNKTKEVILVPDRATGKVYKYTIDENGKQQPAGYLYRDASGKIKENNALNDNQSWTQEIKNFQFVHAKKFLNEIYPGSYNK